MSSRLNAHFAISPLLYDHSATWDSRDGLGARSLPVGGARSSSAEAEHGTSNFGLLNHLCQYKAITYWRPGKVLYVCVSCYFLL